jgi:hypothetical protein
MTTPKVKRGDTFSAACQREGVDITATIIRSQIRSGAWVQELTVTKTNAATGEFTLSATPAQSEFWPIGKAVWDIEYTDSGAVRSTETVNLLIVEDVTHDN